MIAASAAPLGLALLIDRLRDRVEFLKGRNIFPTFDAADVAEVLDVLAAQQARIVELENGIRAHRDASWIGRLFPYPNDAALWALLGEDPL